MEQEIKKIRLAVIGSREFSNKERLFKILDTNKHQIKLIVSGGARGADTLATEWATERGIPYLVFPALWRDPETGLQDKGAGFRRNWDIIRQADKVLAFWDMKSKGTANSLDIAKLLNKPVKIIDISKEIEEAKQKEEDTPADLYYQ